MDDSPKVTASEVYARAEEFRILRQFDRAFDLFREVCLGRHGRPSDKMLRNAYTKALKCSSRLQRWPETEAVAREALSRFPDFALAHCHLGEALLQLGRPALARRALARSIELDPEQDVARGLLGILTSGTVASAPARPLRIWPTHATDFNDPRKLIRRFLLRAAAEDPFIGPDSVFMTLGSCFALNLGRRLQELGYGAHFEDIGEEVNSTYANRYLFEWLEHGPTSPQTQVMQDGYGSASRDRLRAALAASNVLVLTLGVAPSFFDAQTGAFAFTSTGSRTGLDHLHGGHVMRTTTVAENIENIDAILDMAGRLSGPGGRTVLTVSPVPLSGTTEFDSAVIADCLSKSTLRLACHEVVTARADRGVIYWPSFEIVRWLGAHFGHNLPPVFGVEDGNMRHVSAWLIEIIIDQFLEHWSVRDTHAA